MAGLLRFAVAASAATAIILLLTFGTSTLHLWVGGHLHVRGLILRSFVLLPIVLGLVAGLWPSPRLHRSRLVAAAIGAGVGFAYGYLAPRVAEGVHFWRAFEHWPPLGFGRMGWLGIGNMGWDLEVAALVCGVAAGTCALLLSITTRSRLVIVAAVIIVLTAALVPAPTYDHITHNQELTVAIVTPCSADATTNKPNVVADVYSTPVDVDGVTNRVLGLLRDEGIRGPYLMSDLYRGGHGKQVLAVIVLNQRIVSKVQLQEPRGGDVVYLQQPTGWKKIPPQMPTLERSLSLEPPVNADAIAVLTINQVGLSRGLEIWKTTD